MPTLVTAKMDGPLRSRGGREASAERCYVLGVYRGWNHHLLPLLKIQTTYNLEFQLPHFHLPALSEALSIRAMAAGPFPRPSFPVP